MNFDIKTSVDLCGFVRAQIANAAFLLIHTKIPRRDVPGNDVPTIDEGTPRTAR
ncbi:MAG: hypothetical protein J6X44_00570 [Thermoguttaceae bacterium]|nr:hypothetical protein [Thermoguttaceae bacterium]